MDTLVEADSVLADRAHDADKRVLEPLAAGATCAVIPSKVTRAVQREHDRHLYEARHLIEVFHEALKFGCQVEAAQLGDAMHLKRFVIARSVVAWRLSWLRHLDEQDRDDSFEAVLDAEEWQLLYRLEHHTAKPPKTAPTAREALLWIANLGGYLNRESDPGPEVISLWRGWERLSEMVDGYRAICGES